MRFLILLNAVICFISANPLPADRLKWAYNRTFAGFEKGFYLLHFYKI